MSVLQLIGRMAGHFPTTIMRIRYLKRFHRPLRLKSPRDMFEVMVANALANRNNPLWAQLADKANAWRYVADKIGEEHANRPIGVYDTPDQIDYASLPDRFVIKTNNGCGTNLIVTDKSKLDIAFADTQLRKWLRFPYGQLTGQMHYAHIEPKIVIEKFLEDPGAQSTSLIDYKFLCIHGRPVYMYIYFNRKPNSHVPDSLVFDMDGRLMLEYMEDKSVKPIPLPHSFEKMKTLAAKLSEGFDFVRIDFYEIDGTPILGEFSFTPGLELTTPEFLTLLADIYRQG